MAKWSGKSKGNKLGYQIFIILLQKGGIAPAYFLLNFVKWYYILFAKKSIAPLSDLYLNKLQYSKRESRKLIKKNITIFGQTIIDKIAMMSKVATPLTVTHTGYEHIEALAAQGKGGILVSAHLGNYEMAGHLLKRYNTIINIVMYDGESEQLKQYLDNVTGPKTFNIIFIKDDLSHIYEITAALGRNELICIHADRYVEGNRTITHAFLGQNAKFPLGPFVLASKLKAPVCFTFAFKESKYHYHFYAYTPKTYEGRGMTGAEMMLEDYTCILEVNVKRYPEQWFNYYDFWGK